MKTFALKISSPEGDLYHGKATQLTVRGTEGELAILAGHIPFATALVAGTCALTDENGEERKATIDGGLLTVSADGVLLLTGSLAWHTCSTAGMQL